MTRYCCELMADHLLHDNSIEYHAVTRSYSIKLLNDEYGTHQYIHYCPWCGSKLPSSLNGIWSHTLKQEYNIKDPIFDDAEKVPSEFQTDEWWKKRGL